MDLEEIIVYIKSIRASEIKKCFLAGANALDAKKEAINDLNVFPVPDGDTGTNMTMTIMSAAREVAALEDADIKSLCKAISSGSLRGARGNSGVILSQLFRGFTKEISRADTEVDTFVLARAFERAVESAYKAVMKPKEGTILTVARAGAEKAVELVHQTDNLAEFMNSVIMHMQDALEQTPDMLPVLKEAGVVDSGGEGLLTILQGAYDAMIGKEVNDSIASEEHPAEISARPVESAAVAEADIRFGYCTEFIIMPEKPFDTADEKKLKDYLGTIGDSIVCVSDEEIVKIHVHTNDPGLVIQKALEYGQLSRIKIDNMREEHQERLIRQHKTDGFISVSVGDGLHEIFSKLGVDLVIEGGQTMNPSTEDILKAIRSVDADNVFVLPNNANIILAAEQAKELTKDKQVFVIPSKNIPQGISAMIGFTDGVSAEDKAESMTEALSTVKAGQVTYAVRDTTIDGIEIKSGDIMGLSGKTIETVGTDVADTTIALLRAMIEPDSELVTLYYGEEMTREDAEKIAAELALGYKDIEVEIQYGGQPIYYYFLSVE
jgi:hypothetical protein